MRIEQKTWTKDIGWKILSNTLGDNKPQLVLIFGGRKVLEDEEHFNTLKSSYPDSNIVMISTAGEIADTTVRDNSLSSVAIYFSKSKLQFEHGKITDDDKGELLGGNLAKKLSKKGLTHVMVFSDGLKVNGTSLVKGITDNLPENISVTGGLVGDGSDFKKTVVGLNNVPGEGGVVLIGFYGESLTIGYGSLGGWDSFGPIRLITKSEENILYEIDDKPALDLYKQYLGDQAMDLPSSGLLFPLNLYIKDKNGKEVEVVRTLLAINEEDKSMTFAGDMPEGSKVNLMKVNFDRLIAGAAGAAGMSKESLENNAPELAILISCVGRKLVLKDKVEEEVEAVREKLGKDTIITGFYSYGEISPITPTEKQCKLHNQTMTITTFKGE